MLYNSCIAIKKNITSLNFFYGIRYVFKLLKRKKKGKI